MEIYGKTLNIDEKQFKIYKLFQEMDEIVNRKVKADFEHLKGNNYVGTPYQEFTETVKGFSKEIKAILRSYEISANINWDKLAEKPILITDTGYKLLQIAIHELTEQAFAGFNTVTDSFYKQELSKAEGLSFGILSNSLYDHIVYTIMSEKKAAEERAKAADRAFERAGDYQIQCHLKAREMVKAYCYSEAYPRLMEQYVYYMDLAKHYICESCGVSYDSLCRAFNEEASNKVFNVESVSQDSVIKSLELFPTNAKTIMKTIESGIYDHSVGEYVKGWDSGALSLLDQQVKIFCNKDKESNEILNRKPVNDNNRNKINNLKDLYATSSGEGYIQNSDRWNSVILYVYEDYWRKAHEKYERFFERYSNEKMKALVSEKGSDALNDSLFKEIPDGRLLECFKVFISDFQNKDAFELAGYSKDVNVDEDSFESLFIKKRKEYLTGILEQNYQDSVETVGRSNNISALETAIGSLLRLGGYKDAQDYRLNAVQKVIRLIKERIVNVSVSIEDSKKELDSLNNELRKTEEVFDANKHKLFGDGARKKKEAQTKIPNIKNDIDSVTRKITEMSNEVALLKTKLASYDG